MGGGEQPMGRRPPEDEAYALNIANKKLEMATFMFQEDLLTEQELRSLTAELKQVLLPAKK